MDSILVGITADAGPEAYTSSKTYTNAVLRAGGVPVILPHVIEAIPAYLETCDAFVFAGGDDPRMEPFGQPTHPSARPMNADRQAFEVALLNALIDHPGTPVLGVCLGMQLMSLVHGGNLDQHLPDSLPTHAQHFDKKTHAITGLLGQGDVQSHHRQAVNDPGDLEVVASSSDGVIEAVCDPSRVFYLGVQWHPERTDDPALGAGLFERLIAAAVRSKNDRRADRTRTRQSQSVEHPVRVIGDHTV